VTPAAIEALRAAVQANSDIADARHAGDLPLCQFLLQMRELYRWQQGLDFATVPARDALGPWLAEREAAWAEIEQLPFGPLPLGDAAVDAFDLDVINERLNPQGWVYGAGWVDVGRPGFFLARLLQFEPGSPAVQHCGREVARGLFAPPAALQGGRTIVLRRDALARWLWMLWEGFALQRPAGAFATLMRAHAVHDSASFIAVLPRLVDLAVGVLLWHERGEAQAATWLEPGWAALRSATVDRRTTLQLRAVRDLIADCSLTLPALLDHGPPAAMHFWFATFEGMRALLHPALGEAYAAWQSGDGGAALRAACEVGKTRFGALALELLAMEESAAVGPRIESAARPAASRQAPRGE
jgi:hypothetical protein